MAKAGFVNAEIDGTGYKSVFGSEMNFVLAFTIPAVLIPFALHSLAFPNQIFVGTVVNALLASSAFFISMRSAAPLIFLPSVGAIASGFVFGGFSLSAAYLIPFIWIGNAVYVFGFKKFKIAGKMNYALCALACSVIKAGAIGLPAYGLFLAGLVPQALVIPMTLVQFATAMLGAAIAYPAISVLKKKSK